MSAPASDLHTTVVASSTARQQLVMLHGIYGRGRNWQTIAREVMGARPDWSALLVDLRLHGESPAFEPPHTLQAAAADVGRLIDARQAAGDLPIRAILGHSFGGKTALSLGLAPPEDLRQIWVIDATPDTHTAMGSAWKMLQDVRSLPGTFAARADAVTAMQELGWPVGVASWMATNLRYTDPAPGSGDGEAAQGTFRWTLDFDAMESLLRSYFTTDLWPVIESPPPTLDIHIVKAQDSNTVTEETCARIERAAAANGRVHLHRVAGGHWLHADNPRALVDLLTRELTAS